MYQSVRVRGAGLGGGLPLARSGAPCRTSRTSGVRSRAGCARRDLTRAAARSSPARESIPLGAVRRNRRHCGSGATVCRRGAQYRGQSRRYVRSGCPRPLSSTRLAGGFFGGWPDACSLPDGGPVFSMYSGCTCSVLLPRLTAWPAAHIYNQSRTQARARAISQGADVLPSAVQLMAAGVLPDCGWVHEARKWQAFQLGADRGPLRKNSMGVGFAGYCR